MKTYEFSAFITVTAPSLAEAKEAAEELTLSVSKSGDISLSLDDGEPVDVTEDE